MTSGASLLEVQDLRTCFRTRDGLFAAVDGVSFSVEPGETHCLVGESGSGKSVTCFSILNLLPTSSAYVESGRVLFEGQDILRKSDEQLRKIRGNEIAMIFQEPMNALNPVFPIGDQIAEVVQLHQRKSRSQAMQHAREMLELVGIPDPARRLGNYPHELSGGMRQRAMIAIALSCHPKLLIADEPTTALDVTVQAQILDLIAELQRDIGMAVIFVTHDLGVVAEIADRVTVMYAGKAVEQADVETIFAGPRMPYTSSLLASVPRVDRLQSLDGRLPSVPGNMPNPANMPSGCAFHPRCAHAADACSTMKPDLHESETGHLVRCLRWRDIESPRQQGSAGQ